MRTAIPGWRFMLAVSLPFLAVAAWEWLSGYAAYNAPMVDFLMYRDAAARWLDGGSFYQPWQLQGQYEAWGRYGAVLYPPPMLLLLIPFTFLPAFLWVAIPLAIIGGVIAYHRPPPIAWPFLAMCLAWPNTMMVIAHGNPTLWIVAFVALGTVWGWPAVAVFLKPSLFPFAFIGANRRSWWLVLVVSALVSLAFLPLWFDWWKALTGPTDIGLGYSVKEIPTLLLPVVAWLGKNPLPQVDRRG